MIAKKESRRLAYAYKRSFNAIAVTSSTTAVAFLANVFSDIRPIRAFGLLAAILIPVNFFIVIFMMPSVQILHDRYFKERYRYKTCCCSCLRKKKPLPKNAVADLDKAAADDSLNVGEKEPIKVDVITKFFAGIHNKWVFKLRYLIMFCFIALGIVASLTATGIGPLSKQENFLPESDPLIILIDDISENFSSTSGLKENIMVKINWGIKDLDRSDVGLWDSKNLGKLIWDDEFTISPPPNQVALMDFCTELRDKNPLV